VTDHVQKLNAAGAKWFKATKPDGEIQYFVAFKACDVKNWLNAGHDTKIEETTHEEAISVGAIDLCPL
jgi:hypothetical protein